MDIKGAKRAGRGDRSSAWAAGLFAAAMAASMGALCWAGWSQPPMGSCSSAFARGAGR